MNARHQLIVLIIAIITIHSCKKQTELSPNNQTVNDEIISAPPGGNYWQTSASFVAPRSNASSFVINGKAYVFGGFFNNTYKKDLWEYNPLSNTWALKASLPFGVLGRTHVATFVINNKGYIVGGALGPLNGFETNETWEYDPVNNSWLQRASIPTAREYATGFAINGKGYIAMGHTIPTDTYLNDVLEYDPVANTWITKSSLTAPGQNLARAKPISFVINNKAYIGTGHRINIDDIAFFKDLWEYEPVANSWIQKADFPPGERTGSLGFASSTTGYVGTGLHHFNGQSQLMKDFWKYRPLTNTWTQLPDFPGSARNHASGFFVGNKSYIGLGYSSDNYFTNDFYKYNPATSIINPGMN